MKNVFLLLFGLLTFVGFNEAAARPAANAATAATPRILYSRPTLHRPNYTIYKVHKKKHRLFGLF